MKCVASAKMKTAPTLICSVGAVTELLEFDFRAWTILKSRAAPLGSRNYTIIPR